MSPAAALEASGAQSFQFFRSPPLTIEVRLAATVSTDVRPSVAGVLAALLAVPVGGWLHYALETAVARALVCHGAERRSVDGVRRYWLDTDAVVARTLPVPGGVVSRPVIETLSGAKLAAAVTHERHHLRPKQRALSVAGTLPSAPVGRNALLSFLDAPACERAADDRAAGSEGAATLAAALQKLDGLDGHSRPAPHPLSAPYALLYGTVFDGAAHRTVDDRIEAVSSEPSDR